MFFNTERVLLTVFGANPFPLIPPDVRRSLLKSTTSLLEMSLISCVPNLGVRYECIVFDAKGVTSGNHTSLRQMENVLQHKRIIHPRISDCDRELTGIIDSLFTAMAARFPGYEFTVTGALMQFYGYVFHHHLYATNSETGLKFQAQQLMFKDVISYIERNYTERILLADLARQAGMSPKYFCSVFYKMTQKTPIDYLNAYRIECACEKLITTDRTVTEIAFACGFNDVSYFTKLFQRYKNTTPLRYRRSVANEITVP